MFEFATIINSTGVPKKVSSKVPKTCMLEGLLIAATSEEGCFPCSCKVDEFTFTTTLPSLGYFSNPSRVILAVCFLMASSGTY
jgi:hypothetical protein